jgi:alkaline phosphatase
MIADGFGPAGLTMARDAQGRPLALDGIVTGLVHTASADSRITDSAAGATAFAAGVRTNNGAIAVDTAGLPVATILEAAQDRGMATGLVATSSITHATPASFAAHVHSRSEEVKIAGQLVNSAVDLLLGGGRQFFVPSPDGRREDGRDLIAEAHLAGYQVVADRDEMFAVDSVPILGLFSESHMPYEIDRRDDKQPSLSDMTRHAIRLLSEDPAGFLLVIEGSRIDHAAHVNDAAAMLAEILAYDEALRHVLEFANTDGSTLVVSVADHETGGMTLGRDGVYSWSPEILSQVKRSSGAIVNALTSTAKPDSVLAVDAGIDDLTEVEQDGLVRAVTDGDTRQVYSTYADIVSKRAGIGWTSSGHTATDIVLGSYGPGRDLFVGSFHSSEVGRRLSEAAGFDLDSMTQDLRAAE